jgi:hypothetical protein
MCPINNFKIYTCTNKDCYTWPVLKEKYNVKYEKAVTPALNGNDWFHAKIVVQYPKMTVFVNGNYEPGLVIDKLNDRKIDPAATMTGGEQDNAFAALRPLGATNC